MSLSRFSDMGEVQELKRVICTVRREKSGGNEVCQEANALLPVEPLSVSPPVDCSFKGKHVPNDRAGHPVVFEESVKLQVAWKHQRSGSKLAPRGQAGTTGGLARTQTVDWQGQYQGHHRFLVWQYLSLSPRCRYRQSHPQEEGTWPR